MGNLKLFVVLLGGRQPDDKIESHNLFIGVGEDIKSLLPAMKKMWKGVKKMHVDGYLALDQVDGYKICITKNTEGKIPDLEQFPKLMIANIGYYERGKLNEGHNLIPVFIKDATESLQKKLEKSDANFLKGQALGESARSHVDDKHIVSEIQKFDVDDLFDVAKEVPNYLFEYVAIDKKEMKINTMVLGYEFVRELAAIPE